MFLGWYDPDKARPAVEKVRNAAARYTEKFGGLPETCLCSPDDARDLPLEGVGEMVVRAVAFIPRYTYYVGVEEPSAAD